MTDRHGAVAWGNAVGAIDTRGPFFADLARATTNTGDPEGAAKWLLGLVSSYLQRQGLRDGPWAAFDFAVHDIEAIDAAWPVVRRAAQGYRNQGRVVPHETLAHIARFVVERMPSIWDGPSWHPHEPATRALVMADRADTLVGMFAAGMKPNGSKDPYALRRAAVHWLRQVMFPVTRPAAALRAIGEG